MLVERLSGKIGIVRWIVFRTNMIKSTLSESEQERYLRQITLDEIGEEGQLRLRNSSVLIVGVGGLGSPVATLLVSSGIGRIGVVDFDVVGLSNLPRQTLYTTEDIGKPKVECAVRRLRAMNPEVEIESYQVRFTKENAEQILSHYDMVVDGCDNMATRYVIDEAAAALGRPYIFGAISGFVGQLSVFHHNGAGGYQDLFPLESAPEPTAPPAVMATTPTLIGAMEANEVLKIAAEYGESLAGRLLTFDSRNYTLSIFEI